MEGGGTLVACSNSKWKIVLDRFHGNSRTPVYAIIVLCVLGVQCFGLLGVQCSVYCVNRK